jgi:DNA-3-methyladenine glycosylase I
METSRCSWPAKDTLMIAYHDEEWGVPVHDDLKWFEFLLLDAFQAGLSWRTILHRREGFRKAFDNFDYLKIAAYGEEDYERLLNDASIIRNRAKIRGTIKNAQAFIAIREEFGSFDKYIWQFTEGKTIVNCVKQMSDIPVRTELSDRISIALKKRDFAFVGSTICYSFMQAAGMINDHQEDCFRFGICCGK